MTIHIVFISYSHKDEIQRPAAYTIGCAASRRSNIFM